MPTATRTAKEIAELRGEAHAEMKRLHELATKEKRDLTPEEDAAFDKASDEYDSLTKEYERSEKLRIVDEHSDQRTDDRDRWNGDARRRGEEIITEEQRCLGMQAWMLRQYGEPNKNEEAGLAALEKFEIDPDKKFLDFDLRMDFDPIHEAWYTSRYGLRYGFGASELRCRPSGRSPAYRAMGTPAGAGGETIPEGFMREFEMALLAFGGVRQVARIWRTASGEDIPWPTSDDTGNTGALLAENTAATEQDMVTAALVFNAFKYTSKLVKVSAELMQDSAFNIVQILARALGERIGRITNTHFTTGDGSSKPKGIVVASSLGTTSVSATVLIPDEFIDLFHSVDPAYRGPGSGWMMNDGVVKIIRKFKGSDNNYLWQSGLALGMPDALLGRPITVNQDMVATPAAVAKVVLFGQMNKYIVRDVGTLRLKRLVERFADADQEGFVAFSRHDGDLLDAGTKPVKHLIMAV